MQISEIKQYITGTFPKANITEANGDIFFMTESNEKLPFATIVTSDNEFDHSSNLNREGFYRLNIGVEKKEFELLFEGLPKEKGYYAYQNSGIDFSRENVLMPHPVYGAMNWICVVNPTHATFEKLKKYLAVSYSKVSKE